MIPGPATYDHRANVWAQRDEVGATFREKRRRWKRVQERVWCKVYPTRERREDTGGGERTTGEWKAILPNSAEVVEGDVLELYDGPQAPEQLKVDQAHRPGGRGPGGHLELVLVDFKGKLDA